MSINIADLAEWAWDKGYSAAVQDQRHEPSAPVTDRNWAGDPIEGARDPFKDVDPHWNEPTGTGEAVDPADLSTTPDSPIAVETTPEIEDYSGGYDAGYAAGVSIGRSEGIELRNDAAREEFNRAWNAALDYARSEIEDNFEALASTYAQAKEQQDFDPQSGADPKDAVLALIDRRIAEVKR